MADKTDPISEAELAAGIKSAAPFESEFKSSAQGPRNINLALEAVATEWRTTFDAVSEGIVILDPEGRLKRMNRSALLLAKGHYRNHIGKPLQHLGSRMPWPQVSQLREDLLACRASRSIAVKDSKCGKSWLLSGSLITATEPADERIIIVLHDQTERVKLEESLRSSEKLAAMGQLIAGVSHEVRNPLFGISATLDAFESRYGDRPESRTYIDVLRRQVDRMTRLMENLFEFGRPVRLALEPNELQGVIEEAAQSCTPLAEQEQVRDQRQLEVPVADN